MFRLHERTQRKVLCAAFVVCCLLPTALVVLLGIWRRMPGHVESEARKLGALLGMQAELQRVVHPWPGTIRYEGLVLADPETGRMLASIDSVSAHWTRHVDQAGRRRALLRLTAGQVEIERSAIHRIRGLVERALRRELGAGEVDVELNAAVVRCRMPEAVVALSNVEGRLEELPGGAQAQLAFRLRGRGGQQSAEPVRLRVVRNRQVQPPASGFELDTGGTAVPCVLLAEGWEPCEALGSRARFSGYLWANQTSGAGQDGWEGELTGEVLDVDLGRLAERCLPGQLAAFGQATIHSARFRHGRLQQASATLTCGPGSISRSLLDAGSRRLGFQSLGQAPAEGPTVPFEQLAFAVAIDQRGVWFQGRCAAGTPGTIITDAKNWLLGEPPLSRQPLPLVSLIRALCPAEGSYATLPVTSQGAWLAEHLPLGTPADPQSSDRTMALQPQQP